MPDDLDAQLATVLLDTMRMSLRVSIGHIQFTDAAGRVVWRITARAEDGQAWTGEHEDYYQAALLLAELTGFDVMDG